MRAADYELKLFGHLRRIPNAEAVQVSFVFLGYLDRRNQAGTLRAF